MNCENFLFLIDDFIEGELESQESLEFSEHLAVCKSCAFSYEKCRREQEVFENYFLKAEATPALWKNLQSAMRSEKIAQPSYSSMTIAGKYKKVFSNPFLVFSPKKIAFAGFGILILSTFIFIFTGRENSPVEYTESNNKIQPSYQINEQPERPTTTSGINQKENARINQAMIVTEQAAAKRPRIKNFRRPSKQIKALPEGNIEIGSKQTKSKSDLLPGEQKYLETIARLTAEVKSVETNMPPVLSVEYKRNLSTVNQAIAETRSAAQRYPKNPDVANFVLSAYRGKIALLTEVARQSKFSTSSF